MQNHIHAWNLSVEEAIKLQSELSSKIDRINRVDVSALKTVAGIDAAYKDCRGTAAIVVASFPDMAILEQVTAEVPVIFPYIPGLLSFREGPVVLEAFKKLTVQPQVLLFDSQGYAHPRRFGLACHVGLYLDIPSIGCAKTRLIGEYEEPGPNIGDSSPLFDPDENEVIGTVLRTRANTKPLFISIGHKIDLPTAVEVVLKCLKGYRLPEPTRQADILADIK
jgi:deoxyribonuclease V